MVESGKSTTFEYLDFVLEIGKKEGDTYPVEVIQSPAGGAKEVMKLPLDESNLKMQLLGIENSLLRSATSYRLAPTQEEDEIRKFGAGLFDALFTKSVQDFYDISLDRARSQGKGLRIKLILTAPELVALPWEFLYDARDSEYLCFSRKTPVARSSILPISIQPLPIEPPLHILGMIAAPRNLPPLDIQMEKDRLQKSLKDFLEAGLLTLEWLEGQTWRDLQRAMRHGPWHVFHFIGHGGFDPTRDEGFLVFCDDQGERDDIRATSLARLIADQSSIRLVFLNSCEGARSGTEEVLSSTASILLQHGIAAVLAMQYPISDRAAVEFSRTFYEALADGLPVDAAVTEGRQGISVAFDDSLEWGTPVLYSQSLEGNIFDIAPKVLPSAIPVKAVSEPPAEAPKPVQVIPKTKPGPAGEAAPPVSTRFSDLKQFPKKWITAGVIAGILLLLFIVGMAIKNAGGNKPTPVVLNPENATPTATLTAVFTPSPTPEASFTPAPSGTPTASPTPTASLTPTQTPLPTMISDVQGVAMVLIPGGSFQMGMDPELSFQECQKFASNCILERFADEAPVHSVELTSFYMDEKEVTNAQYADCVDQGKCVLPQELKSKNRPKYYNNYLYADYPVIYVTWEDASSYCKWRGASLPTEAQWEYAARGGLEGYIYPWGITAPVCSAGKKNGAQFNDKDKCSNSDTVQVGLFAPNDYGLYDMAGNVWEWVADRYKTDYYRNSPLLNPPGPEDGVYRVIRGGGWESEGHFLSVAIRHRLSPGTGSQNVGFRCVREP